MSNTLMKFIQHAKEGLRNLYFSKLRSLLALLGILVGTASVVAMVLGGELATHEALKQFQSLGTDLLALSINDLNDTQETTSKTIHLNLHDALALESADPKIKLAAPYTQLFAPISFQGELLNGMVMGVSKNFADLMKIHLQAGRFVSLADRYAFYCVIGQDIFEALKKISTRNPIGQRLQIGKNLFVIVGVAAEWPENNFVYSNINASILIPIEASLVISKYTAINNIIFRLEKNTDLSLIESILSNRIKNDIGEKQITFRSAKELIAKMKKQSDIMTVFLGLIGSISLMVGGIGVMNIMLVSVIERRKEIGVRLAVGARRIDIQSLFLMEAIMLSLLGGIIGVLLGIVIAYGIASWWDWTFTLFWQPPIAGFTVSVLAGIFFGFYPAYQASKLDPITALRSE